MIRDFSDKNFIFLRTDKKGTPVLWENYKKYNELKKVIKIIDINGNDKQSIFSKNNETYLIPVIENDIIIKIFNDNDKISITLLLIKEINKYSNEGICSVIGRFSDSEWKINNVYQNTFNKLKTKIDDVLKFNIF